MEAGYDYLHGRLKRSVTNFAGIALLTIGLALLVSGGAYYLYAANAKSNLDALVSVAESRTVNPITGDLASQVNLFPGRAVTPEYWTDLSAYEPLSIRLHRWFDGFTPVDEHDLMFANIPPVDRIMVPAIGVDSAVSELSIVDLGDTRHYESPNNTVGHIPETGPGRENRNSWFFGHTESPISREGSVFFNLQSVPEKLRAGDDILIITAHGNSQFLYRAISSQVIHQDDLMLDTTPSSDINLVSSVPRFVYDHRLVISGKLVGQK